MDGPRRNPRTLRMNRNGQWSMDALFHNNWVLGGLAFFWLLGSVVLLVGVVATMKLAYLPVLSKGFPSHVMGLTKKEALVMVSFAVTVHLVLLFLFLGMVLKERSYRNDDEVEGGSPERANTEGNQLAEQDGGTIREKELDLPPCYDCLVGEETPPPPFHSVVLRPSHSSNSLTSQCQETWPCLSSKYQTPDANKPTFEHIEMVDEGYVNVESTTFELNDEEMTDYANKPNRVENGETKDEIGNAVKFNIEQAGMLDLETEDFIEHSVEHRAVSCLKTSNYDRGQSEQTRFVQIFDDKKPDLDQVAFYETEYATANRTNCGQVAAASGPVITDIGRLDLKQIDVKDIADADKTLLPHGRSVCSKFYPKSHMDNVNQAILVDYTSKTVCLSSEHFKSIECLTSCVEDSSVQDKALVKFHGSSDDESVKQQTYERYSTSQNNNDRQFIYGESEANCLLETKCYGKRPSNAVEFCSQFTIPPSGSQRSALKYLKCNLDGSTRFVVHESKVAIDGGSTRFVEHESKVAIDDGSTRFVEHESKVAIDDGSTRFVVHESKVVIDDGSDKSGDDVSTDTVNESKYNLFNTPVRKPSSQSEGLKEFDTIDNSTFIDEDGIVFDRGNEPLSVKHTDPRPKIDKERLVRKESIGEGGAICQCVIEANQANYVQKTNLLDVTCPTYCEISQAINRNKRAVPGKGSYSSSLEAQTRTMQTTKKRNSSLPHNPIFALSGNKKTEYPFNTISDSLSRQKISQVRDLKREFFSSCNNYQKSGNSNFKNRFALFHPTSLLMSGKSTSEAHGLTYLPAVDRINCCPTFYFSQMDLNSEVVPYFTDVTESRESGIQSSSSLAGSNDCFYHTTNRFCQHGNLDSAVGSYGSIAMQSCASEPCDEDDLAKMV